MKYFNCNDAASCSHEFGMVKYKNCCTIQDANNVYCDTISKNTATIPDVG